MVLCACLLVVPAAAVEMTKMEVERKGKRYYLDSTLQVDAPVDSMYRILADYNSLHQFSRGIVHSQDITPDAQGKARVYTHIYGCIAFFCRSVEKVERIELSEPKKIVTTLDPELSNNVKWNVTTWELEAVKKPVVAKGQSHSVGNEQTRIYYRMEFEPDFWVPPLLGNYLIKKSLRKDGVEIMQRMEAHAQGLYPIDREKNSKRNFPQFEVLLPDQVELTKDEHSEDNDSGDNTAVIKPTAPEKPTPAPKDTD